MQPKNEELLVKYLNEGDLINVEKILFFQPQLNVNITDESGSTPIIYAAKLKNNDLLKALIIRGAEVNSVNKAGESALSVVCKTNNLDGLKILTESGVDLNQKNGYYQSTAIVGAIYNNKLEVLKILVESGAEVITTGNTPVDSPIEIAIEERRTKALEIMLERKADLNITDKNGKTPLLKAVSTFGPDEKIIKMLVENGANINCRDTDGNTPLLIAANYGNVGIVEFLINLGADINAKNYKGDNVLTLAVRKRNYYLEEAVKKAGVENTALTFANNLKNNRNYLQLKEIRLEPGVKYPAHEILKGSTFCQNPQEQKESANNFFDILGEFAHKDERVALILNSLALAALDSKPDKTRLNQIYAQLESSNDKGLKKIMENESLAIPEKNSSGHGLEIHIADGEDILPLTLLRDEVDVNGRCYIPFNTIHFSSLNNPEKSLGVFMHEGIHRLRDITLKQYSGAEEDIKKQVEDREILTEAATQMLELSKSQKVDKGLEGIKSDILKRFNNGMIQSRGDLPEEVAADIGKVLMFCSSKPELKGEINKFYQPLFEYFDKNMAPELYEYIFTNPHRSKLKIPSLIKEGYRQKIATVSKEDKLVKLESKTTEVSKGKSTNKDKSVGKTFQI